MATCAFFGVELEPVKKIFWNNLATAHDLPDPVFPNIAKWFAKKSFILHVTT